jgi:hypothetical protein
VIIKAWWNLISLKARDMGDELVFYLFATLIITQICDVNPVKKINFLLPSISLEHIIKVL